MINQKLLQRVNGKFNLSLLKKIYTTKNSKNLICTNIIGDKYQKNWNKYCKKNWVDYCKKYKINLAYFDDKIELSEKKLNDFAPTWQRLLIGNEIKKRLSGIENVCYLDTDIQINHFLAPNIFKNYNKRKISMISCVKDMPYSRDFIELQKTLSYFRNKFVSKNYPLNSSSLLTVKQLYTYNKLKYYNNYANAGVMIFNLKNHSKLLFDCFKKFLHKNLLERDQTAINFYLQEKKLINWIDYKFNTLWVYEMCFKFPFLYFKKKNNEKLIKDCMFSTFLGSYFVHFAGNWNENKYIKYSNNLSRREKDKLLHLGKYYTKYIDPKVRRRKLILRSK